MAKKYIAKKSENFSEWYHDVVLKAELADYAPVKGCMVIRPYGFSLWEGIQGYMDPQIKKRGIQNAYFPIFIPESFLNREKEHVEGFSPETAVVTFAGGEELKEKLIVRPTSETIMYEMYKRWTQSYRDFPILINQWNNVVRWEKRTHLFLRTSEFLWQEGHCAHETHEQSEEIVQWALGVYVDTYQNLLSLYGIPGVKSNAEKFAGAAKTYTYEMLMPDGKALQGCTSHDLGQNFAKAFEWTVSGPNQEKIYPWQNSWGFSTRSIGGLIMAHGDDDGLTLPPMIAPIKIVLITVLGQDDEKVLKFASEIKNKIESGESEFSGRVEVWDDKGKFGDKTVGWKTNQAELMGIPLVSRIGMKEVESGIVNFSGRLDEIRNIDAHSSDVSVVVESKLKIIQTKLLERHKEFTKTRTYTVHSYVEFKAKMESSEKGFIYVFWCENPECEKKIKDETKASTRCLPLDATEEKGKCIYCGNDASYRWLFAQAY